MPDSHKDFDAKTLSPEEKEALVYDVFQNISETYDRANDVISLGMHRLWKRAMLRRIQALNPTDILDVASGTGDIALALAEKNPQAHVVGSDLSENMLNVARRRGEAAGLANIEFRVENAMQLGLADETFDVAVVSFGLRNMPSYEQVLAEMTRVLRPGGTLFCIDSSYPTNPIIKPFFRFYFKYIMPLLGTLIAHAPKEYKWLNASTEAFVSKDELAGLMRKVGLQEVSFKSHMFGGAATHVGTKPSS